MILHCCKYQGAGNDFVILDNRKGDVLLTDAQVNRLCDRRFGIGADGLMLLGAPACEGMDFSMRYFNADGPEGTMCGNGGRCLVAFAAHLGLKKFEFTAIDGYHRAEILEYGETKCIVRLKMRDLKPENGRNPVERLSDGCFLNTGSPHFVGFVDDVSAYDVDTNGKRLRYDNRFEGGTNVNFVEAVKQDREDAPRGLKVRTYERGVEAETWACGTGVTASSIAAYAYGIQTYDTDKNGRIYFNVQTLGDRLSVDFLTPSDGCFEDIHLTGPAAKVFETEIDIDSLFL
ncbi:MAG: diaminopimelate epimerase [Bacteroidales bacterium]|nr:diaminopimelate epimerase [Candidatus Cacconaster merdequi]